MIIHDGDVSLTTSTVRSLLRAWKAAVTSSNAPHISHAVFLPKWAKDNVWSQPVKAWNARRAFDFASPIVGFHSRDQQPCFSTKTKENVCIIIEFNSHRIGSGHKYGRHFFV